MVSIYFDKDEYRAGETATITYVDAPASSLAAVRRGGVVIHRKVLVSGGSDSFEYTVPSTLGTYTAELWSESRIIAHDTMEVVSGAAPTPPTDFTDTGKVTPSTIEVDPATYDVMFKKSGYKDKIVSNVIVSEGATKTVSATLEPEFVPPVTKTVTFVSIPSGASVNVVPMM